MPADRRQKAQGPDIAPEGAPVEADAGSVPPWEEIAAGRFKPRRIRGSCRGRELG